MQPAPYQRVAAEIRRRILSGEWPAGHQLPSQADLAAELDVTIAEARRGMAVLRQVGVLEGRARARLWVAHPPAVRTLLSVDGDWPHPRGEGAAGSRRADADLAVRLGVPERALVRWHREELLDPDLRPSHLITTWWSGARPKQWARAEAEVVLHHLTSAEGEHLGLPGGMPAWLIQRTRYSSTGRPVETADMVLPADRWRVRLR
ncbi:GntR family transcriptional regulator [Kitasatospora sp. NPDC002551]|uniref:GntR family transcriptional regulator n=1 Tax=Kitasatospora sp. NPDC002551 TaxID=3154539 RepID=UPI0033256FD1